MIRLLFTVGRRQGCRIQTYFWAVQGSTASCSEYWVRSFKLVKNLRDTIIKHAYDPLVWSW